MSRSTKLRAFERSQTPLRAKKRLFNWHNQAILTSDGRQLGECQLGGFAAGEFIRLLGECGMKHELVTKRSAIAAFVGMIALIPFEAHAVLSTEIRPQDVYQAAYCKAFVDGAVSASRRLMPLEVSTVHSEAVSTIRLHSNDLIGGGDNLAFVPLGEAAARSDLIKALGVQGGVRESVRADISVTLKIEDCAALLTEIVQHYKMSSCGYGRNRNYSEELSETERGEKAGLFDRLTEMLKFR
jgi:hypothetical protein